MMKKALYMMPWLFIFGWFVLLTGFVTGKNDEILCKRLEVIISDSTEASFVTAESIRQMIADAGFDVQGYPISSIHTRRMESLLSANPFVRNAEVYTDIDGGLTIDIEQRQPILRIMPAGSRGFYLDAEGVVLPVSSGYTPLVLPVTGNMNGLSLSPGDFILGDTVKHELSAKGQDFIYELFSFSQYINADPFWKSQIVQVYRDSRGEYELIPRVGAHQILMGSMDGFREKLRNLQLLYEQGFGVEGWNAVHQINLKYSNQVICTKR